MAIRKKSPWEEASAFVGNTVNNVTKGVTDFFSQPRPQQKTRIKPSGGIINNAARGVSLQLPKIQAKAQNLVNPDFYNPKVYDANPKTPQRDNFWAPKEINLNVPRQKSRVKLKSSGLESGKIVPEVRPFDNSIPGTVGNMAANIPGMLVNSIIGQGLTVPAADLARLARGETSKYSQLKSGQARIGAQLLGLVNPQSAQEFGTNMQGQEVLGNLGQTVAPITDAWGGGQVFKIGKQGLTQFGKGGVMDYLKAGANIMPAGLSSVLATELNLNRYEPSVRDQVMKSAINTAIAAPVIFVAGSAFHGLGQGARKLVEQFGPESANFVVNKGVMSEYLNTGQLAPEEMAGLTKLNGGIGMQTGQGPVWAFMRKAFPEDFGPNGEPLPTLGPRIEALNQESPDALISIRPQDNPNIARPEGLQGEGPIDPAAMAAQQEARLTAMQEEPSLIPETTKPLEGVEQALTDSATIKPVDAADTGPRQGEDPFNMSEGDAQAALKSLLSDKELEFMGVGKIDTPEGKSAQGKYYESMVQVVQQNGMVQDRTLFHEAFHAYADKFAAKEAYNQAINDALGIGGVNTQADAAEFLAEGFADYMAKRRTFTGKIAAFFEDILSGVKQLIGKESAARMMYADLKSGKATPINESTISEDAAQFRKKSDEEVIGPRPALTDEMPAPKQPAGLDEAIENIPTADLKRGIKEDSEFAGAFKEELVRRGITKGVKERKFTGSARESERVMQDTKKNLYGVYEGITNRESLDKAFKVIEKDYTAARNDFMQGKLSSDESKVSSIGEIPDFMARGLVLMEMEGQMGNAKGQAEVANKLAEFATPFGQGIQLLSTLQRMTPEGMEQFAEKLYAKANSKIDVLRKAGLREEAKLDDAQKKQLRDLMVKITGMPKGPERDKLMTEAMEVIAKKMPPGAMELIDAYRYQNILSNPLTHLRNFWGNFTQIAFTKPLTHSVAAGADIIQAGIFGKEREYYMSEIPEYYRGAWNAVPLAAHAFAEAFNKNATINQPDLRADDIIKGVRANNVPRALRVVPQVLEAGDRFFLKIVEEGEYAALRSKNMPDEEARKLAEEASQKWLFRKEIDPKNKTGQGYVLSGYDIVTKEVYRLRKWPAVGWFVPFVKTPMNIAKMQLEYSPLGYSTMVGANNKTEQFAKATIGTAVTSIGASFAMAGMTTWEAPADPTEKELFYATGRKPFSVRVGDKWVPLQYFGPFALALAIPAAVKHQYADSKTAMTDSEAERLAGIVGGVAKFYGNATYLTGIGNFMQLATGDYDYGFGSNLAFTAGGAIPLSGLVGYVTRAIDPVYRKVDNSTLVSGFMTGLQRNLPVISKELGSYKDIDGNDAMRELSAYIAPYVVGTVKPEYEDLYKMRIHELQANAVDSYNEKKIEEAAKGGGELPELKSANGSKLSSTDSGFGERLEKKLMGDSKVNENLAEGIQEKEKRTGDFKYLKKLMEEKDKLGLDEEMIGDEFARKDIAAEDLVYDDKTLLEDELQMEQVTYDIEGLEGDDLMSTLISMRHTSEGSRKMLLTDTLIGKMVKAGQLDDATGDYLKTVKYNSETGEIETIAGAGGGGGGKGKKADLTFDQIDFSVPQQKPFQFGEVPGVSDLSVALPKARKVKLEIPKMKSSDFLGNSNAKNLVSPKIPKIRPMATRLNSLGSNT